MASTFMTDDNNDLVVTSQGRFQLETDPVVAAVIKLKHRLQFFQGEWFLDTRIGVPYFDVVYVKNPDLELIRRMIRRIILSCPPIVDVKKVDVFYRPQPRLCAFVFQAVAADGRIVSGGPGQPYLVSSS